MHLEPDARIIYRGRTRRNTRGERTEAMVKDPVCGMTIDENTAAGKSEYNGQTYYFCAPICKTRFDQDPARYAPAPRS
jgi:YHS domain-containing protein